MKSLKQYIRESLFEQETTGRKSARSFMEEIRTMEDVRRFFVYLAEERKVCFHPDDSFYIYVDRDGNPTFTSEECAKFDKLMDRCFYVCDISHKDIYDVANGIMRGSGIKESRDEGYDSYFKESFTVGKKAWKYDNIYHVVRKDGKCNFARKTSRDYEGRNTWDLLCVEWFDSAKDFGEEGYALVMKDSKYNFVNTDGYLVSDEYSHTSWQNAGWFDDADSFMDGAAIVKKDGRWNFINETGRLASTEWFDGVELYRGLILVRQGGEYNLYDQYAEYPEELSEEWFTEFDQVDNFIENYDK